ncbi:PKD domain-containing protein [Mucilaginibacter limnophilus]|uniref:PKD domain-containing protein n=1 Tax=Mucilaginibacter limnophilus TaxID=1932778 RepID=A0A3S2ULI3_9SPHI|nr:PKD domain-containing protein [Mucilaginibacter limnophilus]RVT96466.1 PKD domain-containing protein [Mucilaginibacter limnophilus]
MRNIKVFACMSLMLSSTLISSCKKDETKALTDLVYETAVEGYSVTFTTKTEGLSNVRWEFGDGETSTETNPTHTYPGKGKYVPTLYASVNGKSVEASTVLRIAKTTPVKIDDNSVDDWASVTSSIPLGPKKGVFNEVKMDFDGNYVYLYIDMNRKKSDGDIFDIYLDSDNNTGTGYLTGGIPDGGYDILMEGPFLTGNVDIFYNTGTDQTAWSWQVQTIADAYTVGTVKEAGTNVKFEVRFDRGKLKKGLDNTKGIRIAIQAVKGDWSAFIGYAPDEGSSSFFLDMNDE